MPNSTLHSSIPDHHYHEVDHPIVDDIYHLSIGYAILPMYNQYRVHIQSLSGVLPILIVAVQDIPMVESPGIISHINAKLLLALRIIQSVHS